MLLVASALIWLGGANLGTNDPTTIVGGQTAAVCDFPADVFIGDPSGFHCTGSLVHPRVVITAAHCIGGITHVGFGEVVWEQTIDVPVQSCVEHPSYWDWGIDLGVCTLAADAPPVAMVPVLMGCEADELVPGMSVTIAGFGQSDEASGTGGGIKRWTTNALDEVGWDANEVYLLGESTGSCYGDSGGPSYVQLSDGTWRVLAAVSGPHPSAPPLGCGFGGTYELVHTEMEWIESTTGYDVTPCFDADGTWNPDERCTGFPTALAGIGGSWADACAPVPLSGASATCGPAIGDPDPDPDPDASTDGGALEGHADDGHATDVSTTTANDDATTTGDAEPEDATTDDGAAIPPPDALPPGFGLSEAATGCAVGPRAPAWAGLLALLRRRRRSR